MSNSILERKSKTLFYFKTILHEIFIKNQIYLNISDLHQPEYKILSLFNDIEQEHI